MSGESSAPDRRALLRDALRAVDEMQAKLDAVERRHHEPIAIVGIGCRFPGGVTSPDEYWRLLHDGVHAVSEVPAERFGREDIGRFERPGASALPVFYGGFLDGIDRFDPHLFGISPREAASMDPQQRLVLEVSWEALEHAGVAPNSLATTRTGVFIGITTSDYADVVKAADPLALDVYMATGNARNAAAGRVSYVLGLRGPCMAVDTACSSSLTAVHLACQSLRAGESTLALAGGVNAILTPDPFVIFSRWGMMAPDGRCKTFDAGADGFVRAEGCGIIVLKRLADARAAGDTVLAVIRGSAVNQDGASSGLTVPNGLAQQEVIRQALATAHVAPPDVSYVEAHGTGTSLGDPIELEALDAVLGEGRSPDRPLTVGSVKTNLGHLESAAGVAGLIKVVLSLQHGEIPPHLHFTRLTPRAELRGPIVVPTDRRPWALGERPRIAGVSSFGFSGTNAHVVIEEAPWSVGVASPVDRSLHLLPLSAKSEQVLSSLAGRWEQALTTVPAAALPDACFTAGTGRAHFAHRAVVAVRSPEQARQALAALARGVDVVGTRRGRLRAPRPRIGFLFTGQGSQYVGMGRDLYETCPPFRRALERCDELLRPHLDRSLLSVLYPDGPAPSPLDETAFTQPALVALQYALAETWREWGVRPSAVLGHSVGEFAAACIAGVMELDAVLALVAARGRLMQALPRGAMAAVLADEETVAEAVRPHAALVAVAAVNGPDSVVLSGAESALETVLRQLAARGVSAQRLAVSHAFHSPLMDPMLDAFQALVAGTRFSAPHLDLVSNVTGKVASAEDLGRAAYWREHVRAPVRFAAGMAALAELGVDVFLEIGPTPTLLGIGRRCLPQAAHAWLPSLRKGRDDWEQMLESLGALYVEGVDVDWAGYDRPYGRRRVAAPTYPFERTRCWVEPGPRDASRRDATPPTPHALRGARVLSPRLEEAVFEYTVASDSPPFLADHRLHGIVVFPGTAYLATMLAAAACVRPEVRLSLSDVVISEPLILAGDARRVVQVVVAGGEAPALSAEVFSRLADDAPAPAWTLHATATIAAAPAGCDHPAASLEQGRHKCGSPVAVDSYYAELAQIGLDYGPAFRGLRELWRGEGEAIGRIELDLPPGDDDTYAVHPALLDACFHLFGPVLTASDAAGAGTDIFVPVGVELFTEHVSAGSRVWARAVLRAPRPDGGGVQGDLHLFDDSGRVVACVHGLSLRRAPSEALRTLGGRARAADSLYEPAWIPAPRRPLPARDASGTWLVLADRGGVGAALAASLEQRGGRCVMVAAAEAGDALGSGPIQVDPVDSAAVRDLVLKQVASSGLRGVVYLWSLDIRAADDERWPGANDSRGVPGLLHLVRALDGFGDRSSPLLAVVTRGAQPIGSAWTDLDLAAAPLWGFARSVAAESPALGCRLFDLDPAAEPLADVSALADELLAPDAEEAQVAWRRSERHVFRLLPAGSVGAVRTPPPHALEQASPGVLEGLELRATMVPAPAPDEVQIRVHATGLNFRDVLNALGMYPGEAGPLGSECVGDVGAVGAAVSHLAPGQRVMAITARGFATFVNAKANVTWPLPDGISLVDAATVPIAFLTALYALDRVAGLKRGERVLIHAAAGGVGLAAVQLAHRAGAEVFATAGSPEKRDFLRRLGVQHVMDSRTLAFAEDIQAATAGEGVDVVLNALTGASIRKSLSVLRSGGRFLEIGKTELLTPDEVAAINPGATYTVIFLGDVCQREPALASDMMRELTEALVRGEIRPLPRRVFELADAVSAFRFMAQARHIGKVVVRQSAVEPVRFEPEAVYLVTGGLGGLGLEVAAWMVERGARHVTLAGRRPPSDAAHERIAALAAAGAEISVAAVDIADPEQVQVLLAGLNRDRRLRGIVHAAGLLDDGALAGQTATRAAGVLAPKAGGAWQLHHLTRHDSLDFFVLFSAGAALFGSAGQSTYAAANAFLDVLAHERRATGLAALSVNWGPWAEVGMAARLDERDRRRWASRGVGFIAPGEGTAILGAAMEQAKAQLAAIPIDWAALGADVPAVLSLAAPTRGGAASAPARQRVDPILARLEAADPVDRLDVLRAHVREHVRHVLGIHAGQLLDDDRGLTELGMDSLMAVELSHRLKASLARRDVPTTVAFEHPTVNLLADHLASLLDLDAAPPAQRAAALTDEDAALAAMSDDDVERTLAAELDQAGY